MTHGHRRTAVFDHPRLAQPEQSQTLAITHLPVETTTVQLGRATDKPDPPIPALMKMPHHFASGIDVRKTYRLLDRRARHIPRFDDRHLRTLEHRARSGGVIRAGQHDAFGPVRQHDAQKLLLLLRVVVGIAEQQLQTMRRDRRVQAVNGIGEVRTRHRRHQRDDERRAPGRERARRSVRHIPKLLDHSEHALAHRYGYIAVGQHARHGHFRHAGLARDVRHRRHEL